MFITDLNVNLLFDPEEQLRIDQALGSPLQVMPDPSQAGKVFIIQKNNTLTILTYAQAKLMMKELDFRSSNNPVHLYMMNPEDYDRYTRGDMPLFRPKIIDRLGQRLASLFTNDMGKVLALMLTFAALPFVNILVAPILFMTSNFFFHLLRYRLAFKRWPNNRETLHILAKSILAGMEVFTGLMILTLLSGVSVFAPVAVHLLSILGIAYGGPLITYLVLPLLFATILATGVTLFNLAVVIINHFFDVKLTLNRQFPFLLNVNVKNNRENWKTLVKNMLLTSAKEFSCSFITTLASIYLSYIPVALIVSYLVQTPIATATSQVMMFGIKLGIVCLNSFVLALALDKSFDMTITPFISQKLDAFQHENQEDLKQLNVNSPQFEQNDDNILRPSSEIPRSQNCSKPARFFDNRPDVSDESESEDDSHTNAPGS